MVDQIMGAKDYAAFKSGLSSFACTLCTLSKARTQVVVDRGNPMAQTIIIGEAPGAEEDRLGEAFVGRSGKLLDENCKKAGISTSNDCLIINICKCRPPDNRPPTDSEAQACRPFLEKQISLVQPKYIIFLGRTSLRILGKEYKKRPMADLVGKLMQDKRLPNIKFMVLYHPAYILRNRSKEKLFFEHLKLFKEQSTLA